MDDFHSLPSASPHSARFPSPNNGSDPDSKRSRNKIPSTMKRLYVVGTICSMVFLALVIEIALFLSHKFGGFPIGKSIERVQLLSGFLPTLAIGPLVWIWKRTDKDFKKMQPYVILSQGPAAAEESILMDLEHANILRVAKTSWRKGYFLIIGSSILVLATILLHPLAGSFFLVRQTKTKHPSDTFVHSTATIGLNPSYKDITAFVAAAGFADAAAFHNLTDPPFVHGSWAIAQFKFPLDVTKNSTIAVKTFGVRTNATCAAAETLSLAAPVASAPLNWTLTASLPSRGPGCTATRSIDSTAALSQYGVSPIPDCADNGATRGNPFVPVMFWYFNTPPTGSPVASAVFCAPIISAYAVEAVADGATGLILSVNITGDVDSGSNNVTGGDFAGKAFNGISFDSVSDFNLTDPFVRARALAVQSEIPGAIFRFAADQNGGGGLSQIFANATGFLGLTQKTYTQYMSTFAQSTYFVPTDTTVQAKLTLWPTRLWINPITAHAMAALLLLVSIAGAVLHFIHARQRKRLYLASSPGSIAHYMSILSDPQLATGMSRNDAWRGHGMPTSVGPLDSRKTMRRKLGRMRFVLDTKTGAVVPAYSDGRRESRTGESERWRKSAMSGYELEDPRRSLLGPEFKVEPYDDSKARRESSTVESEVRRATISGSVDGSEYGEDAQRKELLDSTLKVERYRDPFDHENSP